MCMLEYILKCLVSIDRDLEPMHLSPNIHVGTGRECTDSTKHRKAVFSDNTLEEQDDKPILKTIYQATEDNSHQNRLGIVVYCDGISFLL